MIISDIVLAIYLVYRMSSDEQKHKSTMFFYLPLVVCALLIICVIYNSITIIYEIYKFFRTKQLYKDLDKD